MKPLREYVVTVIGVTAVDVEERASNGGSPPQCLGPLGTSRLSSLGTRRSRIALFASFVALLAVSAHFLLSSSLFMIKIGLIRLLTCAKIRDQSRSEFN